MALESTTTIEGLNSSYPASTDAISAGDDHIRLVKSAILASFPSVDQAVQCIHVKATAPSTNVAAGLIWFDSTDDVLKLRNEANNAWVSLPISPLTSWKIMGSATVGWTLPTADGTSGQFLKTNGAGALSWGSDASYTNVVTKISHFEDSTGTSVRSASWTDIYSFTYTKLSSTSSLTFMINVFAGLWNYGTLANGEMRLYDVDNSARIGAFDLDAAGQWNNLGASASNNNEVRSITSWSAQESTPLSSGSKSFKLQGNMNQPSSGGMAVDDISVIVLESE
jgi:hypothetical protein